MDAAASPLPSEETTPPVTKMYLVVRPSLMSLFTWRQWPDRPTTRAVSCRARGRAEQPAHVLKIFRRVDVNRIVRRLDGLDADAVLERAKLFERLGALERRRLERRQHEQGAAAIRVQTDMFIERGASAARIAGVGDGRERDIQGKDAANEVHIDA